MSLKKLPVAINVFPSLDYVELVQFDEKTGEIEKASALPCSFDTAARQMSDRDQMMQTIRDLFSMNRIPYTTPAVLVLPSFFTREIELPAEFSKDELRFALVSEAERFYIFKKSEPQIGWINLDEARLLYSAFPKAEIEKYMKVFQELRIPLLGIELSYFSTGTSRLNIPEAISNPWELSLPLSAGPSGRLG
jgi:Tfp pilus assembly PilM family ATPase